MKVFLGGTCNGSAWRELLIPLLEIEYFNPVVPDWTPECYEEELKQRQECDFVLYVITPRMTGVYSIAEVVDDSNKRPEKTIFSFLSEDDGLEFTVGQIKSLLATTEMVRGNGAMFCNTIRDIANYVNSRRN
jgi:hypothetical protein